MDRHPEARAASRTGWLDKSLAAVRLLWQASDRRVRGGLAVAGLLVLSSSGLAALSPILLKLLVDRLSIGGRPDTDHVLIGALIVGYAIAQWLGRASSELRILVAGRTDQRLNRQLTSRALSTVLAFPAGRYLGLKPGALAQTLADGLLGYRLVVQHLTSSVLPVLVDLVLIGAVLTALDQPVFLAIVGFSVVLYLAVFYAGAADLTNAAREVSVSQIEASSLLTETVHGLETIKYLCAERAFHQRFSVKLHKSYMHWSRFFVRNGVHGVCIATIFGVSLLTSTYVVAVKVEAGQMTIGDFVLVNSYMLQAARPLEMLGHAFRDVVRGLAFIEQLVDLLRHGSEITVSGGQPVPPGAGSLEFDQVTFSYPGSTPVLKQVSFHLQSGQTVAVVGPSGSGKSSLVRLVVRFFEPDSGQILFDAVPVSEIDLAALRSAIAVVPQDILLFDDTVANNIAVGASTSNDEDICDAAAIAGIHDAICTWPFGYQTIIGDRGARLSGGERQRIAIARAIIRRPRLLVFDEATSALDAVTERQIFSNIAATKRKFSTLIVAHRLSTIVEADEILVLAEGSIVGRGSHARLIRNCSIYQRMWGAQQRNAFR